ncbi:LacI family DNA-binding transcriptional regulator [Streptomyces mirabilis]|uniref:LacI family DNA-binding transcriptional regulator n=1 Tax=Streptomyces mirabilis TaxID=68239 RepID=UPI003669C37E
MKGSRRLLNRSSHVTGPFRVSRATVSHVLDDDVRRSISDATRERVRRAARARPTGVRHSESPRTRAARPVRPSPTPLDAAGTGRDRAARRSALR